MTVASKEERCLTYLDSIPYTCYEVAHCWEPSCVRASFDTMRDSFKFSLKVYLAFYGVSFL